ncbi:thioredoxin [Flammula alnicola]|nr:thioredoxin [Flammula alnicola]
MPSTFINSVEEFRQIIRGDSPVIVFFCVERWSYPCQQISPTYERYSEIPELRALEFYKVDCDNQPDISNYCNIQNAPTFSIYQSGRKMHEVVGSHTPSLQGLLKRYYAR